MNFVYITTNLVNGKQYIGSHNGEEGDSYLGSGKILKEAIKKYGKENFKREILEICDINKNLELESKYIKEHNTLVPNGYNILEHGEYNEFTEELRKKLSESKKGRKFSDEHKEKLSKARIGKKLSEDTKNKMSDFQKGREKSETERKNISNSKKGKNNPMYGKTPWNKGKKLVK